ncbi:ABC-2 type transport system ATP-binding protein [Halanaerobium saccharolyticum]|uniref:ABC-2 type transport system ATP-binding protein n=1 Tax=Halanaerobium saccharolyticum TaxID=43595 RepID=A0A4R7Z6Q6_9FIRM|nr:ABC transporter ATP-binding protein [Halanaerobium saccharolyticum]RAK08644.1 ABC-2 type transport system ATP-binding protein [Halanaerobium saccharolyticum]TDW07213.1 ABC-2 type transport system ATP-binding protein [Halanaerobium saccharolyticum]TDX60196.1 ABC-2 type transport system ATP-binding protein [Halanaerobium saccharolyticum]
MNENIIEVSNLKKKFPGVQALKGINLNIPEGMITGIVGPNGSGKSTLLKIISGLIIKDEGQVNINRKNKQRHLMQDIAFLPEINHLYRWMRISEMVKFHEDQFSDFSTKKAEELLDFMNLKLEQKIDNLSKGMVARLKLILVLSRSTKILILDEPLAGIDPASRERILESLIGEFDSANQSIILATHEIIEAERFLDHVIFMEAGEILLDGNADDLRAEKGKSIRELIGEVFE